MKKGQPFLLHFLFVVSEMAACPVTEANLVNVTGLPVPLRWLLAVVVVLISGFFAGEPEGDGGGGAERDARQIGRAHV